MNTARAARIRTTACLLAVSVSPVSLAYGAEVQFLSVAHDGKDYSISASFVIDGCVSAVRDVFTDFATLMRMNPSVSESAQLQRSTDDALVTTTLHECVLFFCEDLVMVAEMRRTQSGSLTASVLPGYGDFSAGWAQWRFVGLGAQTQVIYDGQMHVERRLPPLFGPRIVRRSLEKNLRATVVNAERLAAGPDTEGEIDLPAETCSPSADVGDSR